MPSITRRLLDRIRWYELLPEAVLAIGLGLFAATEPHAAASAFKSTKAIVLMVVVGLGWLAFRLATFALASRKLPRFLLFSVAAVAVLRVVVFPAYDNHTVVETLGRAPSTTAATAVAATPTTAETALIDPVKISSGELSGIDHRASGVVNIYRRATGSFVVGLEEFDIQPGPAYVLYVVEGAGRRDIDGGARVAALRGNRGSQFYETSDTTDFRNGEWTVLVWCETFDVPVAYATPAPLME